MHPRWGTPWVAIAVYGLAGALCAVLSQAGSSVLSAYDVLVSMSIVTYFIPFMFLFLSMIRLQREPAPLGVMRLFGGRRAALGLAWTGLLTTVLTIGLALVPADEEPNKRLAVAKVIGSTVLLVGAGVLVFWMRERRVRMGEGA